MDDERRVRLGPLVGAVALASAALAVVFAAGTSGPAPSTQPPPLAAPSSSTTVPPAPSTSGPPRIPVTTTGTRTSNRPIEGAPGWLAISGGPLTPRFGASAVWIDGTLMLWGGLPLDDGGTSDGATFRRGRAGGPWAPTAPAPLVGGDAAIVVPTEDHALVVTGASAALYDPNDDEWAQLASQEVGPIARPLTGVWTGSEIIVIGAARYAPEPGKLAATSFGPDGNCCRIIPDPPIRLTEAWTFWTGDRLLLVGGLIDVATNTPSVAADRPQFAAYDPGTNTWEVLPSPDVSGVQALATAWNGVDLVVWDYGNTAAAWRPDNGWRELPDLPFEFARCYPEGVAAASGRTFAFYCGEAAYFDPVANRWSRIAGPRVDSFLPIGACVPVGSVDDDADIWMWCVHDDPVLWTVDLDEVETIGVSTPASASSWELVPQPEWSERESATLAWTGAELMVWGGFDGITEVFDGWAYDSQTGVMHRIPDAPSPGRPGQSAVWTGDELVVWRGPITAWDPVELAWRTIEPSTPTTQLHPGNTAVWTGTDVLFWGASQFVGGSEGGAVLTPDTGEWRPLPASPVGPRTGAVVAWSGEELYIWGGLAFGARTWEQEGAAYDPDTDTWRLLSALPEDIHLSGPVGDWVDGELIIFGSNWDHVRPEGAPDVAGAAYEPGSDTWRVIADLPGPTWPGEGMAGAMSAVASADRLAVWLPAWYFGDEPGIGFYHPASDSWERWAGAPVDAYAPAIVAAGDTVATLTPDGLLILTP